MTARRCPLHESPLHGGRRTRVPATALAGRKQAFHSAERARFPAAAAFLFCRTGTLQAEYCPECRGGLRAWLASCGDADFRETLEAALAAAESPA